MPAGQRTVNAFSMGNFTWWIGVVEDRDDPEKIGRVRVRIFGYHSDSTDQISTDSLVWCQVMLPTTSSGIGGIGSPAFVLPGSHVVGFFLDGEAAQNPVIMGVIGAKAEEKTDDDTKGFRDPDGVYPRYDKGEPDTNKLHRGVTENTVVEWRKGNLDTATKAGGGTFKEPATPYAAEYPYNRSFESEPSPGEDVSDKDPPDNSGHIMEFDDTPDAERVYIQHKKGTFIEWHPDGTEVHKVMADRYVIVESDEHLHVKGEGMVTIDGSCYINVLGDCTINIGGNVTETIGGDYSLKIAGEYDVTVGANHTDIAGGVRTITASAIHLN